jgi:small subunit ribosomal protein S1
LVPGERVPPLDDEAQVEWAWQLAQKSWEDDEIFELEVMDYNRGGLLVHLHGLRAFVPASQLVDSPNHLEDEEREAELSGRVGKNLSLKIIDVDRDRNRLILSERAAISSEEREARLLAELCEGDIRRGRVTNLCSFGAFVDLGGVEGLIHVSEMSWGRVRHPDDVLEYGREVEVYVLNVDREAKKIGLSLKRLQPDPWTTVEERYQVGQLVEGTITNVVSFGAFTQVEEGLEGLIHISELAEGNFLHPRNVVKEGDVVTARILNIDSINHRLGLSLRQGGELGSW